MDFGAIMDFVGGNIRNLLGYVLMLLPDSPFQRIFASSPNSQVAVILGYVNYFIPISEALAIMQAWLVAIAIVITYQAIMRYIHAIG